MSGTSHEAGNAGQPANGSAREDPLSVAKLTRALSEQAGHLIREELELAKAEAVVKARRAGIGAGLLAGAAGFAVLVLGALTTAAIAALSLAVATWLAALIVAGAFVLIVAALALAGVRAILRATPPIPEQAAQSVKEDVRWARFRVQQARR